MPLLGRATISNTDDDLGEDDLPTEEVEVDGDEIIIPEMPNVWSSNTLTFFGPDTRCINLTGGIDDSLSAAICSQIYQLSFSDPDAPITMYINTPGGNIIDGLAIYDAMMTVSNPIVTIVNGSCFSAGLFIACAGSLRLTTPNSVYFYHQPGFHNIDVDSTLGIDATHEFYWWCKKKTDHIMREHIKMSKRKWNKLLGNHPGMYFDAKKAIKYGFADDCIQFQIKPQINLE